MHEMFPILNGCWCIMLNADLISFGMQTPLQTASMDPLKLSMQLQTAPARQATLPCGIFW
jgi:hypothetical protein